MKYVTSNKNGLTLLELIIAIAVLFILVAIVISSFIGLRNTQALNSASEQINAMIDEARFKTLSSKKSLQYGVHFETNKIVLFEGDTFVESLPGNKEFVLSAFVEISNIELNGGGSDVFFQKLTGSTNQYGTITIRSVKNNSNAKIIKIEQTGIVNIQI